MAPLVYVCVRPQADAAEAEYASFREATGLDQRGLERIDLTRDALPPDAFTRWRGFLVGGSPFNTTDLEDEKSSAQRRLEADLVRIAHAATADPTTATATAALFTCYGIGVATRALGGEVTRDYAEDTGPAEIEVTAEGRDDALFGSLAPAFSALTAHKEATARLPRGAVLLATSTTCPVQAYRLGSRLYTTQFHPEPTTTAFTERMTVYRNHGYFDPEEYDIVAARVLAASVTEPVRLLRAFAETF